MTKYTLDYSEQRVGMPRRRRRANVSAVVLVGAFGALVSGLLITQTISLRGENRQLRRQLDAQVLQYDSLLAAKLHADRQLVRWHEQQRINTSNSILTQD
ncbi:hypothetical protein [Spirosoma montaniterrae]|uniref:Cell division protein FtsL n=1 Tax=Spirosoma montaniterrae TaxID=1178516 RepID=A0A1P9WZP7_9BACT|nr:hypothetical protein [Spirosoma montaniterrae]AQG80834.1 hypothetical protein AWR27_16820 [Spirosoma montaniterrae]